MKKVFNTTGSCVPEKHYMVDISKRLEDIKKMIDNGSYITISRARQYGKTTTLVALERYLADSYCVLSLDFQDLDESAFSNSSEFSKTIARIVLDAAEYGGPMLSEFIKSSFTDLSIRTDGVKLDELFRVFKNWISESEKPIVLMIDEVDSASDDQVFLDFLAQLRSIYLKRTKNPDIPAFQSVILAGVTDIKHLKGKIRDNEQHKVNSPWNIAEDLKLDMSLHEDGISGMLAEYETDHNTGMDIENIAHEIYAYTNGYPFLVCKICQILDSSEELRTKLEDESSVWTKRGVDEAVGILLREPGVSLFESLIGKLTNYPVMKKQLFSILMDGDRVEALPYDDAQQQLRMYGFVSESEGTLRISNRIFETLLYNHFIGEDLSNQSIKQAAAQDRNMFVKDKQLNVPLIMERFIKTYTEVFGPLTDRFPEETGRKLFLLYLKPIINGTGNYYIEAQTRDQKRTDIIIDYLGRQYVIELKVWRGERYNAEGEQQIMEYLEYYGLSCGYMLSFNFNKKKETGVKELVFGDKVLYEGML